MWIFEFCNDFIIKDELHPKNNCKNPFKSNTEPMNDDCFDNYSVNALKCLFSCKYTWLNNSIQRHTTKIKTLTKLLINWTFYDRIEAEIIEHNQTKNDT